MKAERVEPEPCVDMHEDIRIRTCSDPRLLGAIRGLVRGYFQNLGFPPEQTDSIVLAIDEACSNAIRHAYSRRPDGVIELAFRADEECAEVVVRDFGRPARQDQVKRRTLDAPCLQTLPQGGFGVQFIHQVFDDVEYTPGTRRGNRVRMKLSRPARAPSARPGSG